MITCNLMGGLGNQLFQIFTTISYAIKSHNAFKFTDAKQLGGKNITTRNTYWNTFLHKLKYFTVSQFPQMHFIKETNFTFNELPIYDMVNKDVLIYGYFQSYKYFEENFDRISRIIGIEQIRQELLKKLNMNLQSFENTISMHFRLGDYKHLQHVHPILSNEYYYRSLSYILSNSTIVSSNKTTVMYFCEDEDVDEVKNTILFLSNCFPYVKFIRGENTLEDWEQMVLMSCCHHNIIANSSFSWWSAYLNNWKNKIVCYPSTWFGPLASHDTKDLCPPDWIRISI